MSRLPCILLYQSPIVLPTGACRVCTVHSTTRLLVHAHAHGTPNPNLDVAEARPGPSALSRPHAAALCAWRECNCRPIDDTAACLAVHLSACLHRLRLHRRVYTVGCLSPFLLMLIQMSQGVKELSRCGSLTGLDVDTRSTSPTESHILSALCWRRRRRWLI